MKYFFSYRVPDGVGFAPYGPGHLAWLAASACAVVLLCLRYRALSPGRRKRMELAVCWTVFALDIIRLVYQIACDGFSPGLLPLHLCGMAVYLSLLRALRPGPVKDEILFSLCMPGAATAILFPGWTRYPLANIFSIFCFLIHILLVADPLMLAAGGDLRPDWKRLPQCLLFLAAVCPPLWFFNRAFGTNFMFLNSTEGIFPLTLFERWFGNPGYLFGMFLLLLTVWAMLYLAERLVRRAGKRQRTS